MRAAAAFRLARFPIAVVIAVALIADIAGCGSASKTATGAGLSVNVTIAHGEVTPANATLQATVHQPITLHVTSDAADELHVHSVPDHKFQVAVAANQTFQFTVTTLGRPSIFQPSNAL